MKIIKHTICYAHYHLFIRGWWVIIDFAYELFRGNKKVAKSLRNYYKIYNMTVFRIKKQRNNIINMYRRALEKYEFCVIKVVLFEVYTFKFVFSNILLKIQFL